MYMAAAGACVQVSGLRFTEHARGVSWHIAATAVMATEKCLRSVRSRHRRLLGLGPPPALDAGQRLPATGREQHLHAVPLQQPARHEEVGRAVVVHDLRQAGFGQLPGR